MNLVLRIVVEFIHKLLYIKMQLSLIINITYKRS